MDKVGKNTLEEMGRAVWYNGYIYNYIKKYLAGNILEIGCGIGNFIPYFRKSGTLTSIDIRNDYIKKLRKKYRDVRFGIGNIEKNTYFFKTQKFDSIVSLNVFEHIKDDSAAIRNTYKLLNDKGYFVILVPAHSILFSKLDTLLGHYRRYSKSTLEKKLIHTGFKTVQIKYFNWWAAIGWLVFVKIFGINKMPGGPVKVFDIFGKYLLHLEKYISPPFGLSVIAVCQK